MLEGVRGDLGCFQEVVPSALMQENGPHPEVLLGVGSRSGKRAEGARDGPMQMSSIRGSHCGMGLRGVGMGLRGVGSAWKQFRGPRSFSTVEGCGFGAIVVKVTK